MVVRRCNRSPLEGKNRGLAGERRDNNATGEECMWRKQFWAKGNIYRVGRDSEMEWSRESREAKRRKGEEATV